MSIYAYIILWIPPLIIRIIYFSSQVDDKVSRPDTSGEKTEELTRAGRLVGTLAATVTMAIYGKRGAGRRLGAAHARGAPRRDADGYCWAGRVAT